MEGKREMKTLSYAVELDRGGNSRKLMEEVQNWQQLGHWRLNLFKNGELEEQQQ